MTDATLPSPDGHRMYTDLAPWWTLLSAPEDYAEEAAFYLEVLQDAVEGPLGTILELGSGGGNNAFHLKASARMTLVEPAAGMRAQSEALNPDCEHRGGDMRTVRVGRTFDAVFIHDAIVYMTTEADLRQAMATAFAHCRPGGAAVFAPDYTKETFRPGTDDGGHDGEDGRSLRYLEWIWDPDPSDTTYVVDYAFLLRSPDGGVHVDHEQHREGVFPRETWLRLLAEVGFEPGRVPFTHTEVERPLDVFVGRRPGSARSSPDGA